MKKKNNNTLKFIIVLLLIILFIILIFLLTLEKKAINNQENTNIVVDNQNKEPTSIEEVIIKHDSKVIKRERNKIYVKFCKDLYEENGESNERYFNKIIEESEKFVKERTEIIDQEKNIAIVLDIKNNEKYKITINDDEDFYENVDGDSYIAAEKTKIADAINLRIDSPELNTMVISNMRTNKSKKYLGEKTGEEDGYDIYQDGAIKIKEYENSKDRVRNIIFTRDCQNGIMYGIEKDDTLQEIANKYDIIAFGSVSEGFLGYRTPDVYVFYYDDEVSVYGYSYELHSDFEWYLEKYLEDKNLSNFARNLVLTMDNYYDYNYNGEEQSLYLTYPGRGIEINIKDNNPKGITLYNNYYLSDKTKDFIKKGLISINPDEDYIYKIEMERVNKK